jgi:hypothetical protein
MDCIAKLSYGMIVYIKNNNTVIVGKFTRKSIDLGYDVFYHSTGVIDLIHRELEPYTTIF